MYKYPLIGGSFCAVVLIVIASLTNVVGYQSVKSTSISDSPLFSVRTQKATQQETNRVISYYLGKGEENSIQIPLNDDRTNLIQKAIERIIAMDDRTFNTFLRYIVFQSTASSTYTSVEIQQLITRLRQIRQNPAGFDANKNIYHKDLTSWVGCVFTTKDAPTICWFPGCVLFWILVIIFDLSLAIMDKIGSILNPNPWC